MKKFLFVLCLIFISLPVKAEIMAVQAITPISTETPEKTIKVRVIHDCKLDNIDLKAGDILEGKMMEVIDPKRLKQDASFTFAPLSYTNAYGKEYHIAKLYTGEYSPKFDVKPANVAKSAVLSVGNHFVKGLKSGYYAVEGAVQNKDDNRAKSAIHNVYDNSVFSYAEKGGQLHIKEDTCFGLKFDECTNEKD